MTSQSENREQLVDQFRDYLASHPLEQESERVDLFRLFTELAALRNEVRLESRQLKKALDQLRDGLVLQEKQHEHLLEAEARNQEQQAAQLEAMKKTSRRPLLCELIDLWDRLNSAAGALQSRPPDWNSRFLSQDETLIESLRQGQEMTLARLTAVLRGQQVVRIPVLEQTFDPHLMRAIETTADPALADGVVSLELRTGFTWEGEVLRFAEVSINRINKGEDP